MWRGTCDGKLRKLDDFIWILSQITLAPSETGSAVAEDQRLLKENVSFKNVMWQFG